MDNWLYCISHETVERASCGLVLLTQIPRLFSFLILLMAPELKEPSTRRAYSAECERGPTNFNL